MNCSQFQVSCSSAMTSDLPAARECVSGHASLWRLKKPDLINQYGAWDSSLFFCMQTPQTEFSAAYRSITFWWVSPSRSSFMYLLLKAKWVCHRISANWTAISQRSAGLSLDLTSYSTQMKDVGLRKQKRVNEREKLQPWKYSRANNGALQQNKKKR